MNVLVACEESQAVCKAFRRRGHNAYSCDILECSGGHPEWHLHQDVLAVIRNRGGILENGDTYFLPEGQEWDLMIETLKPKKVLVYGEIFDFMNGVEIEQIETFTETMRKRMNNNE